MTKAELTRLIKDKALQEGFDQVGISATEYLMEEAPRLKEWLERGMNGTMIYMENHFEKRLDPRKLVPGAKSVISVLYNYSPSQQWPLKEFKIAKYAWGKDYHKVIKRKLKSLLKEIEVVTGDSSARLFVDSAPVMERQWAKKSGLGWIGKNSLLINRQMGSYFFIAEIISNLELEYDQPIGNYCGSCNRCMEACPTDAIVAPSVVNASKCISYLTIERKEDIGEEFKGRMQEWLFGCDICQA